MDYRRLKAIQKTNEKRLQSINRSITEDSGIYTFTRRDENGIVYAYVGQAKNLLARLTQHLMGYSHIDLSIKKRGLYNAETNPNGWCIAVSHCKEEDLDEQERKAILSAAKAGYQMYNKTTGGQGKGKAELGEGKSTRTYREGVSYGRVLAIRDIRVLFEKYLTAVIKGTPNKTKERKLLEFNDLIRGEEQ